MGLELSKSNPILTMYKEVDMSQGIQSKVFKILYGTILGVLLTLIVFAFPSTTSAACSGNNCTGKWPQNEGCNINAYSERTICAGPCSASFVINLRRSSACNATWSRVTNNSGFWFLTNATIWWQVRTQSTNASSTNPGLHTIAHFTTI